jgi:UDP:flavonoid glycosyltransferase YjiC (YdhE family)
MVLLPLFWDQYDNAQRMHETGFGIRLPTYAHQPEQLTGALETLLADRALAARLRAVSERLRAAPGTVVAADVIERVSSGRAPDCGGRPGG